MANAAQIADLLTRGTRGPQGGEDITYYTGVIQSWDNLSGTNTVQVGGTLLSNLSAMQVGIGLAYRAGDVVVVIRKQSQYFVMAKIGAPGSVVSTTGSAPDYQVRAGSLLSGATGGWRDLNGGASVSPTVTLRCGQHAMVSFGVGKVVANNSEVDISVELSGDSTWVAGSFLGQTCTSGSNSGAAGVTVVDAPAKTVFFYKGTSAGAGTGFNGGTVTFALKYRLLLHGTGTGVDVGAPWISVVPFG